MRKILALCLCAWLSLCALSGACESNPYDASVSDSIRLELHGQTLDLAFDGSEEYSSIMDGSVQASFYVYTDNSANLYELYLVFPDSVQSGSVITPDYALQNAPDCSVVLITTIGQTETYYFAGQVDGAAYPDRSGYTMRFDAVTEDGGNRTFRGTLSATLVGVDIDSGDATSSLDIVDAPFSFTMPAANRKSLGDDPFAANPTTAPNPVEPGFTPDPMPAPVPTPAQTWRI